jgi:regulator of RNase E activity RraA
MAEMTDSEQIARIQKRIYSAVVADILDTHGYHNQCLPTIIRPIDDTWKLVGRALTVLGEDISKVDNDPYGLMFDALDDLKPNEIYLATGGTPNYALWGELMATAARARGGVGAILNGAIRDTQALLAMDFPVFCTAHSPQDQMGRGRVIDYRTTIEIEGVPIQNGDLIIGDIDGLVVVPQTIERDIIEAAFEKVSQENIVREELKAGALVKAVYDKYGVL